MVEFMNWDITHYSIFGGLIGSIFTLLSKSAIDWLNRPQLKLLYIEDECKNVSNYRKKDDEGNISETFVKIKLINKGNIIAKNCNIFILSISEVINSNTRKVNFYESKPIKWPGYPDDYKPRDIVKGTNNYGDVVGFTTDSPEWQFKVSNLFASQQNMKKHKGTYRIRLAALAENAKMAECKLDVTFDGTVNSIRVHQSS